MNRLPCNVCFVALALSAAACRDARGPLPEPRIIAASRAQEAPGARPPAPEETPKKPAPSDASLPEYEVRHASEKYDFHLRVTAQRDDSASEVHACSGPGEVQVFRKGDSRAFQKIALDQIWVQLAPDGRPLVNVAGLYDDQGAIIVGDFDFDGREDFAVQVDQHGPYGGPTFAVFLDIPKRGGFVRSEALSAVTRETLGFFRVDPAKRRLITFAKSGCCYHVSEELAVIDGKPVPVRRVIVDATGDDVVETDERLVNARWVRTTRRKRKEP